MAPDNVAVVYPPSLSGVPILLVVPDTEFGFWAGASAAEQPPVRGRNKPNTLTAAPYNPLNNLIINQLHLRQHNHPAAYLLEL